MSTLPYTLVFVLLVLEMAMFGLLVLPLPQHWRSALLKFISRSAMVSQCLYVMKILFVFVFLLFADSVNRLSRVQTPALNNGNMYGHDPRLDAALSSKKFYTQRNLYLTGFTLFLSLILDRTYKLVLENIQRDEEIRNLKSQNSTASKDYERRLAEKIDQHKLEISKLQKQIDSKSTDLETLQKQCKQQSEEYFRLADRHNELERRSLPSETRKDI
ncbi:Endoplasmic reticulum transmembrane protein 3 [Umbelopsis sp. WA50703]